jgi:trans-aconitate 2-methyltransferase
MWDPGTYLTYADERGRPFHELLSRVGAAAPRRVADLGCGPGNQTAALADRWPGAAVEGIDSSAEMIARAATLERRVSFRRADLREWMPGPDTDVVVSNAALHWVPGHPSLLRRWAAALPPGAWLAVQVPGNFDAPSHWAVRDLAGSARWRERLSAVPMPADPVLDPEGYAEMLLDLGCQVDAWETTYLHVLPALSPVHPVLEWLSGTTLRPVRAALGDADWAAFTATLGEELADAYPVGPAGALFPFRRVFVVARTAP